ncbi:C-type lectin domain-containing protein [Caenorhabditis elegans]|uniref:C-type lectin domain-containing protein n=1 Tax=Caenorhabditis elegans TaxID=6239 RepID=O17630_CAEEL|nr:C-type lectin domain-containing protein [Caenorhabditis elegans]CAB03933.1 C-type lectin domain-containing protein [Caenorhabditis elegans]|eukprot:NP_507555.1 C-type LECtin [Caenorhabditis elegans]
MLFLILIPVVNSCIPTQQVETTTSTTTTTTTTTSTTTTTPIPCPTGWEEFERPSGTWCIKMYAALGDRANAISACAAEEAVLSGVQNQAELDYMITAFNAVDTIMAMDTTFWIGGERTSACLTSGLTATCTALTSFEWTDGSTTGTDGWIWRSGEPNNAGGLEICATVEITYVSLADQRCDRADFNGYACGKSPM